jgi:tetratricopeptide (TPR) repeat protein
MASATDSRAIPPAKGLRILSLIAGAVGLVIYLICHNPVWARLLNEALLVCHLTALLMLLAEFAARLRNRSLREKWQVLFVFLGNLLSWRMMAFVAMVLIGPGMSCVAWSNASPIFVTLATTISCAGLAVDCGVWRMNKDRRRRSEVGRLMAAHNYPEALDLMKPCLARNPHVDDLILGGQLFLRQGNHEQGDQLLQRALAKCHDNPYAINDIFRVYVGVKRYDEALEMIDQAIACGGTHIAYHMNRCYCLLALHRLSEARTVWNQIMDSPQATRQALDPALQSFLSELRSKLEDGGSL